MMPIQMITNPVRNKISVSVPKEFSSYSFQVILFPLEKTVAAGAQAGRRRRTPRTTQKRTAFDELWCPILDEGESLDVSRDVTDYGRSVEL